LEYLHLMEIFDMDVASEFLVMAATLLEIKSKMLLPKEKPVDLQPGDEGYDEAQFDDDPRHDLVEKLLEYRRFKLLAMQMRELERQNSRIYTRGIDFEPQPQEFLQISLGAVDLLNLFQSLVRRRLNPPVHRVVIDKVSLAERIKEIREYLTTLKRATTFRELLKDPQNRYEIVLSLMAVLEMAKGGELRVTQKGNFHPIHLRPAAAAAVDGDEEAADDTSEEMTATA
ncbi:MAG TPA: segregation/condensation protein A, partial [Candidatus Ozemobacteraceae bacterium]|nr:segregation/condensation protein A [Candidatus Ozemobacteraceae bacterium]